MYYKCCVPGCISSRQDTILHKFPVCEKRLKKWLEFIPNDFLRNKNVSDIAHLQVCHKHFETRFVTKKSRLLMTAYPTLFLDTEITSGTPLNSPASSEDMHPFPDHQYARKSHYDHMYCKTAVLESHLQTERINTDKSDNANAESKSELAHSVDKETNLVPSYNMDAETDSRVPDTTATFTWQKCSEVTVSDDEDNAHLIGTEIDVADTFLYQDAESSPKDASAAKGDGLSENEQQLHNELYKCNVCTGPIIGFRYRCVQCVDYDLCAACESRGAHERHYVLRIPDHRPYAEIASVIERIRKELMSTNNSVLLEDAHMLDSIKEEVKDELDDPLCEREATEICEHERMECMFTTNYSDDDHSDSEQSKDDTGEEYVAEENEKYVAQESNTRALTSVQGKPVTVVKKLNSLKRKLSTLSTEPAIRILDNTQQRLDTNKISQSQAHSKRPVTQYSFARESQRILLPLVKPLQSSIIPKSNKTTLPHHRKYEPRVQLKSLTAEEIRAAQRHGY